MLLSGSSFKKQLIPDTFPLVPLAFLGALFSAAMQIILAFYLWTRLPPTYPAVNGNNATRQTYPGTGSGGPGAGRSFYDSPLGFARVALPAYEYPNYKFANDVCRTVPIVQLVTIGLFLFSVLNNVPGILKNIAIIWFSDRFVSVDEEGVTKLHYWRESRYMRESADHFVQFLHDEFSDMLKNEKIVKEVEAVREAINEVVDKSTPRTDTHLERLRVTSAVATDEMIPENQAEIVLKAFICEMYLSGCIIQDIKAQKSIKDKLLVQELEELCNKRRAELLMTKPPSTVGSSNASSDHDAHSQTKLNMKKNVDLEVEKFKAEQERRMEHYISSQVKEFKAYSNAARRRWILPKCYTHILPKESSWIPSVFTPCIHFCTSSFASCNSAQAQIPKSFFEVCETRSFLAEALRLIDRGNNTKKVGFVKDLAVEKEPLLFKILRDNSVAWPPPIDIKLSPRPILFCDQARLNLVRIDYLKPNKWTRPSAYKWLKEKDRDEHKTEKQHFKTALRILKEEMRKIEEEKVISMEIEEKKTFSTKTAKSEDDQAGVLKEKKRLREKFDRLIEEYTAKENALKKAISSLVSEEDVKAEKRKLLCSCNRIYKCLTCTSCWPRRPAEDPELVVAMRKSLGRDFADVLAAISFSRHCPSRMGWFRLLAFVFGVLPEVLSLLVMAVAGVQYILWSGFKVDSDTQGMEEIILATLAINFIYEIDDTLYDHVLPELYKEAHERDAFEITGLWTSSETVAILEKCWGSTSSSWWSWGCPIPLTAIESELQEEDCLKDLAKCEPMAWESESGNQVARGYFLRTAGKDEQNGKENENEGGNENAEIGERKSTCTALLVFTQEKEKRPLSTGDNEKKPPLSAEEYKMLDDLEWRARPEQNLTPDQEKQLAQLEVRAKAQLSEKEQQELKKLEIEHLSIDEQQQLKELENLEQELLKQLGLAIEIEKIDHQAQLEMLEVLAFKLLDSDDQTRLEELQDWESAAVNLTLEEFKRRKELRKNIEDLRKKITEDGESTLKEVREQNLTGADNSHLQQLLDYEKELEKLETSTDESRREMELAELKKLKEQAKAKLETSLQKKLDSLQHLRRVGPPLSAVDQNELDILRQRAWTERNLNINEQQKLRNLEVQEKLASILLTAEEHKQLAEVQQKANAGQPLTDDEQKQLYKFNVLVCRQQIKVLKKLGVSKLDENLKNPLVQLQQRFKLGPTLTDSELKQLKKLRELATFGKILNDKERARLKELQERAKVQPVLSPREHMDLLNLQMQDDQVESGVANGAAGENDSKAKLEILRQRAKFGRNLTARDQKDLEDLKEMKAKGIELTSEQETMLDKLVWFDKNEERCIRNCTKGRHLAEKAKYARWCGEFNKTILNPNDFIETIRKPKGVSGQHSLHSKWGKAPFVRAMRMSVTDQWNDIYMAHAYPFLYARKVHYAFSNHWWECFLILYGKLGLHLVVLMALTLIIVGGYRALANCDRFAPDGSVLGIFAKQVLQHACSRESYPPASISPLLLSPFPYFQSFFCTRRIGPTRYLSLPCPLLSSPFLPPSPCLPQTLRHSHSSCPFTPSRSFAGLAQHVPSQCRGFCRLVRGPGGGYGGGLHGSVMRRQRLRAWPG